MASTAGGGLTELCVAAGGAGAAGVADWLFLAEDALVDYSFAVNLNAQKAAAVADGQGMVFGHIHGMAEVGALAAPDTVSGDVDDDAQLRDRHEGGGLAGPALRL